ncbi:hypothetical protein [Streptomyces sp. NPDC057909]|uniref:hypothetical protein n=1 Tax=Streptomyces sp. NPDC057909 TaxID=3346277 RepID=UPI0036EC08FF
MGWCDFWDKNLDDLPGFGTPIACQAKDAAKDGVKDAAASAWEEIVHSFQEGAVWMVKELALGWLKADSPTLSQHSGTVAFLFGSTLAITQWLAVLSLLIAAGRMAWTRRGDPGKEAIAGILRLVVATSAAVAIVNLLTKAGDEFSVWIIDRSLGCKATDASKACIKAFSDKLLDMTALHSVDQLAVSLLLAILLMVSGLVQLFSVIFRQSMLFVLVGTLPLAAAASSTEQGRAWWQKSMGWMLAFVVYKPAAAIIYAAAFSQFSTASDDKEFLSQLYGVALLILAAFSLPALMRFVAPITEQSGIGGGSGGGGGGMASRIATGAIALKTGGVIKGGAAGSAAGGKGSSGPSGGTTAGGGGKPSGGGSSGPSGGGSAGTGGSSGPSSSGGPSGPSSAGSAVRVPPPASGSSTTTPRNESPRGSSK